MIAELGPATGEAIAERAGLNERYVREWLGAMVTGEVVEYDAAERRYHLPAEHAASLTRPRDGRDIRLHHRVRLDSRPGDAERHSTILV
jgi:DNA-binding IclR family transcriptional regulator